MCLFTLCTATPLPQHSPHPFTSLPPHTLICVPSKIDLKLTKIFGGFGFLCFLLGLQAVALFTPGTRGDKADLKGGFILQVIGLCFVLGGVITIVDAGQKDMILPALNFSNFGGAAAAPTNKKVAPTPVPL